MQGKEPKKSTSKEARIFTWRGILKNDTPSLKLGFNLKKLRIFV